MTVTAQRPDVFNQPPPLEGHNAFESNLPLAEAVEREGAGWAVDQLRTLGTEAGAKVAPRSSRSTAIASVPPEPAHGCKARRTRTATCSASG